MIKQTLLLSLLLMPCAIHTMDARISMMRVEGKTLYVQNKKWIGREDEGQRNYGEVVNVNGKMTFVADNAKKDEFDRLEAAYTTTTMDLGAKVAASGMAVQTFVVKGGRIVEQQQNNAAQSDVLSSLEAALKKCTVSEESADTK